MAHLLHFGVWPSDLRTVLFAAKEANRIQRVSIDGSGWEDWEKAVGEGVNDDRTMHITFDVLGPRTRETAWAFLRPIANMTPPRLVDEGAIAILSDTYNPRTYRGLPQTSYAKFF